MKVTLYVPRPVHKPGAEIEDHCCSNFKQAIKDGLVKLYTNTPKGEDEPRPRFWLYAERRYTPDYTPFSRSFGRIEHDPIHHCPWCGTKLPTKLVQEVI